MNHKKEYKKLNGISNVEKKCDDYVRFLSNEIHVSLFELIFANSSLNIYPGMFKRLKNISY